MARAATPPSLPIAPGSLTIHPLTPDRRADFETLFGDKGGHGGCWCMWWRVPNKGYDAGDGNKTAFRSLVEQGTPSGTPPGLLACEGAVPVGWISLGPRADYRRFPSMTSPWFKPVDAAPVWSIVCFFVTAPRRRQGIAAELLAGAVSWAREQGAAVLEAYPVDTAATETRPSTMSLFMGTRTLFAQAGFVEVLRRHPQRPIMRLDLSPPPKGALP